MNKMEPRGRDVQDSSNQFLSASTDGAVGNSHHRSTSLTPSYRTDQTTLTSVDENDFDHVDVKSAIKRQRTWRAEVKITWYDCLMGMLLGPQSIVHKVATTIKTPRIDEIDQEMFDHKECPFILTVSVWPRDNPVLERHHHVRCTLDTGCLQGNIIAFDLFRRLGYTESDFKPLDNREQNGGISVSGHHVKVDGAIHLTWHHSTSPQIFRGMRFLVSKDVECEMLIGTRSIVRHNLISPPNFGLGYTEFIPSDDKEGQKLKSKEANLREELENKKIERRSNGTNPKLDAKIEKIELQHNIAKCKIDKYKAEKFTTDQNQKNIDDTIAEIEKEIKGYEQTLNSRKKNKLGSADKKKAAEKSSKDHEEPHEPVEIPNESTQNATGLFSRRPFKKA